MKPWIIALTLLALIAGSAAFALAATPTHKAYLPLVACDGCTGTPPTPGPAPTTPPAPTPNPNNYATRMIELVNGARAAAGCPAVVANSTLMRAAQDWSTTMANTHNYNHSGGTYYSSYGYTWTTLENITAGSETPEYAFEGWMESATHKRNIEFCYPTPDPSYNPARIYEIGVGYKEGYWTLAIGWRVP